MSPSLFGSTSLMESTKKALRHTVSQNLRCLPESEVRLQSEAVFKHVVSSRAFRESKTVSCFLSMKGEIDTSEIARETLHSGKRLYVPRIISRKEKRMDFLRIYNLEDVESLPSGAWGIREPGMDFRGSKRENISAEDAAPLDLIFVPGVAFDDTLSRLGHGKGYYDLFINTYARKRPCPTLLALSLREQILPRGQIPMMEHDRRMDFIVTCDGILAGRSDSPSKMDKSL